MRKQQTLSKRSRVSKVKELILILYDISHSCSHLVQGVPIDLPAEINVKVRKICKEYGLKNKDHCPACLIHDILERLEQELGIEL